MPQNHLQDTKAIVLDSYCNKYLSDKIYKYTCVNKIRYAVNKQLYEKIVTTNDTKPKKYKSVIDITYNKHDPEKVTTKLVKNNSIANMLLVAGIIITLCAYYYH